MTKGKLRYGFTLIELSIVLVIIGLIVGGVLVGQDLIRAAEIRATIAQIEKYNSAVHTFQSKYGGLPGDLNYQNACAAGFYCAGENGTLGEGDGNGLIQDTGGSTFAVGEIWIFWRHLSDANLIDGNFDTDQEIGGGGDPNAGDLPGELLPPAKLGRGNYIMAYGLTADGNNYFQIQGVLNMQADELGQLSNAMTPIEAQNIDTKLDDGLPMSGDVQATVTDGSFNGQPNTQPTPGNGQNGADTAGGCTITGTPVTYDTGKLGGSVPACGVRLRFN